MNARVFLLALTVFSAVAATRAEAQPGRLWRPEDRSLITSFGDVAALALGRREVYVAGPYGVAVFDYVESAWRPPLAPSAGYPAPEMVTALAYDATADALWLGTEDGILLRFGLTQDRWERVPYDPRDPVIRIVPDADEGVLWAGTPGGWHRVRDDGTSGRFIMRADQVPSHIREIGETDVATQAAVGTLGLDERLRRFPIQAMLQGDRPASYFVATAGAGLMQFDSNTLQRTWLPFGTLSRGVGSIALDGDRIWFGGDAQGPRDGVAFADGGLTRWTHLEAAVDGAPRGFVARIVPAEDAIWFAASDGVYRLDRSRIGSGLRAADWTRYTSADRLPADQATTVVAVSGGAWIGTLRGLARLDVTSRSVNTTLAGLRVLDLALAGDTLWIATQSGLFVSISGGMPARAPGVENAQGLRTGPVVALAAVGGVITALTPAAVHRLEQGQWSAPMRDPATRALGPLFRLHVAADGGVWIAGEAGVAALEEGRPVRTWLVPADIPAGPVRGIVLDGDDLWVATPAGALRLDRTR